jgi:hypothetical protein
MKSVYSPLLGIAAALFLSGCASTKYAELYVVTPQGSADVYSAADGQYLGLTPLSKIFERSSVNHEKLTYPVLLVRDGFKPILMNAVISSWVTNKQDAVLLENRNGYSIDLVQSSNCLCSAPSQSSQ